MKVKTGLALVIVVSLLAICISGCDQLLGIVTDIQVAGTTRQVPQLTDFSGEIPIGTVLPLTGRFVSEFGYLPTQFGAELALNEINDGQLGDARMVFIYEDDGGDIEGSVEAFNRLIHQHGVPVILGPGLSSQAEKAFPIAQENEVVAFSATASAAGLSAIGDFIFRVTLTSDAHIPNSVKVTQERLGYKRVALIYDELHAIAVSGADAFRKALTENKVELLTTETFQTGETDLSTQLTRIKASNPEALFIAALPEDMPEIMIQARDLGIPFSVPFIVPELSIDDVRTAGAAGEGLISSAGWLSTDPNPLNQAFIFNYRAAYGVEPNTWAAHSYATVYILTQAIADARSTEAQAIREAMADIKNLDTVLGNFSFDADGDAAHDATILTVENGEFKVFE